MARSIRGTRRIIVDHHDLRWYADNVISSHLGKGGWSMRITIFARHGGASRLIAELNPESHPALPFSESRVCPRHVEAIARHALAAGWDPVSRKADVQFSDISPILLAAGVV